MARQKSKQLAAAFLILLALAVPLTTVGALKAQSEPAVGQPPAIDQAIETYKKRLEKHPTLWAVHVQLAHAYLAKARVSGDPQWVKLAEANLDKSLRIQPSFDGHKGMAALDAFRHRFADALRWAELATPRPSIDTDVTSLQVEAHVGLGENDKAAKLLPALDSEPMDFYTAAAMAAVLKAQGNHDQAREAYLKAERFAQEQNAPSVAVWARTNAAGMLIDSGRAEQALPDLEAATAIQKDNPELRLHWAEYHEARGAPAKAYAILQGLAKESPHPAYQHRAYKLARKLGKKTAAKRHFAAAEKGYRVALDAKEIYTLGSLAQLYCDADTRLNEALQLAQRNLEYKRDKEATDALACVEGKLPEAGKTAK